MRLLPIALVCLLAAALAGTAVASSPLVPHSAQTMIARQAGAEAAVPTRAPFGYRLRTWHFDSATKTLLFRFSFRNYTNGSHDLYVTVQPFLGTFASCSAGNVKMQQMSGNRVYTSPGQSWRCLKGPHKVVKVLAYGPHLPDTAFGYVVASVKRLR